jgi:hypothetical protein
MPQGPLAEALSLLRNLWQVLGCHAIRNDPETVAAYTVVIAGRRVAATGGARGHGERHTSSGNSAVMVTHGTAASGSRISPRVATQVAWGVGIVAVVVTVAAMALVVATRSVPRPAWERHWQLVLLSIAWYLSFSVVGTFIAARRPANPLGWLLLAIGLTLGLNDFMHYYGTYTLIYRPGTLPLGLAVGWVSTWNEVVPGFVELEVAVPA